MHLVLFIYTNLAVDRANTLIDLFLLQNQVRLFLSNATIYYVTFFPFFYC